MSRLTVVDNNGNWGLKNGYKLENVPSAIYGHICKLKEYEDTELEPEQLDDINNLYLEKCKEVNELKNVMESVRQNSVSHEVYNELLEENKKLKQKGYEQKRFLQKQKKIKKLKQELLDAKKRLDIDKHIYNNKLKAFSYAITSIDENKHLKRDGVEMAKTIAEEIREKEWIKVKYNNLDKKFTSMMTDYENKITSLKIEIMNLKRLVESEELV